MKTQSPNTPRQYPSLAGRALLAVALLVGFYLLALAIAAGLLYIAYAEVKFGQRIHLKVVALCGFGALAILWAVIPRADKFHPPGPALAREQQPKLFAEIDGIALAVKQEVPVEVYLDPDVNAWVTQRGGTMGYGGRRVMGIGLPLLRLLTQSQFRAVLAHEFGHYHGGDTQLGPWIYQTRRTIERTVRTLGSTAEGSVLRLPFVWYSKLFMRITHAISRRQEFVADELAARLVGAKALTDGLRTVHSVAPAFHAYWSSECEPLLQAGFRPPLVDGFDRFVRADTVSKAIAKGLEDALTGRKADPYDTHPPLAERIAAVSTISSMTEPLNDEPALNLLSDIPALESQLLATLAGAERAAELQPVIWDEVATKVYLPQWQKLVRANAAGLRGLTPESLPACIIDAASFAQRFVTLDGVKLGGDQQQMLAATVICAALGTMIARLGGQLRAAPGEKITAHRGDIELEPLDLLPRLGAKTLTAAAWTDQCRHLGILGLDLAGEAHIEA